MWMSARSKALGEAAGLARKRSQSQPWFYWIAEAPVPYRLLFLGISQPHLLFGFLETSRLDIDAPCVRFILFLSTGFNVWRAFARNMMVSEC